MQAKGERVRPKRNDFVTRSRALQLHHTDSWDSCTIPRLRVLHGKTTNESLLNNPIVCDVQQMDEELYDWWLRQEKEMRVRDFG